MSATIGTRLHTILFGRKVGSDEFGNDYYELRGRVRDGTRRRRWVVYHGMPEPSKIPPHWHGWLHYTHDTVPPSGQFVQPHGWVKPHQPNLTGTTGRYLPPGHVQKGGQRSASTADYTAWKPE